MFDFTSILHRQGMDAIAVDALGQGTAPGAPKEGYDPIPMWVADMNFPTAPSVVEAIVRRAQHPAYGYFSPREAYYQAIIDWQSQRNGVTGLEKRHIGYENGVLGGVVSALETAVAPGDPVLVHAPTYIGFTASVQNAGFRLVSSPLVQDEQGIWRMDFDDMEEKLQKHHIHAAIFCSPHNPCGRVWERWELERAMELFRAYDCLVVSDEIWSDLTLEGYHHIPTQSISEDARQRTVALYAPSKTFNLAGLLGSYHIIYNDSLRERVTARGGKSHYNQMNVLGMHGLMGAYSSQGQAWLEELRQVLTGNIDLAMEALSQYEGVSVARPQGTYMLFPDWKDWCAQRGVTLEQLLRAGWDVGVAWQDGRPFGGAWSIRINVALPKSRVEEAFRRLQGALAALG